MKNVNHYFCLFIAVMILSSCEKDEKLWELPPAGPERIVAFNMGDNYENTFFFQLKSGSTTNRNIFSWDIAFASDSTIDQLILNGGKEVQVHLSEDTNYSQVKDIPTDWFWDNPSGSTDTTAFGNCWNPDRTSKNIVYVIDIGRQSNPRYFKMQLIAVNDKQFTIKLGLLTDDDGSIFTIVRNPLTNYTYYNLRDKVTIDYEPPTADWDLVFTRYRHVYYDMNPITPYLVNGAIINRGQVTVAETKAYSFEDIDYAIAQRLTLTAKADEIGYDWKWYDLNGTGKYKVDNQKIYILKTNDGLYYKLRFVDFYDDQGNKGVPKMAYQRL